MSPHRGRAAGTGRKSRRACAGWRDTRVLGRLRTPLGLRAGDRHGPAAHRHHQRARVSAQLRRAHAPHLPDQGHQAAGAAAACGVDAHRPFAGDAARPADGSSRLRPPGRLLRVDLHRVRVRPRPGHRAALADPAFPAGEEGPGRCRQQPRQAHRLPHRAAAQPHGVHGLHRGAAAQPRVRQPLRRQRVDHGLRPLQPSGPAGRCWNCRRVPTRPPTAWPT